MKINLIQTVITILVLKLSWCLHLQQQPRMYDPEKYFNSLQAIQDQLRFKLNQIKQSFQQLDQAIENAVQDPNQQLRLLQEGIADQRDSLFSIQQYLSLPWNERSCKCFNFSQDLRTKLSDQLANVSASLDEVDNKAKECQDCEIAIQIRNQIQYQRNYLKIMEDTVNSKCCKIYTILYNDNLNVSNWMYGNFTPAQYQAWMQEKIKNATINDTFVRMCPLSTPFTSDDLKSCSVCKQQDRIFNLKTRQCEQCPIGKIFNFDKNRCQYDVVCPIGSYFNQDTVTCEKLRPDYNQSVCPPEAPVWNPQSLGCFKCSQQTPYFDKNLNKCTGCPIDYVYDSSISACKHKNCLANQVYNEITKLCQYKSPGSQQVSNSHCPENQPFWDRNSLSCTRCPITQPYYNTTSKKCEICPVGTAYDSTRNTCAKQCSPGQQLNQLTFNCQNITIVVPTTDDRASMCPPDRPIWNSQTKYCSQCPSDTPYWNSANKICSKCPLNQNWNQTTKKCETNTQTSICPTGFTFNPSTGLCQQSGILVACPPQKPLYNAAIMACTQCPLDKPLYDASSNRCLATTSVQPSNNSTQIPVVCSTGYYYDQLSRSCKPLNQSTGSIITMCPPGTPVWDAALGICTICPKDQTWNADRKLCIASDSNISQVNSTSCEYNYQWDNSQGKCIRCLEYQKYNPTTKTCANFCSQGQVYDSNYDICSSTISRCPVGLLFDGQRLVCYCTEGANYRYNDETLKCQIFCKSNQYFDYKDQACYPL